MKKWEYGEESIRIKVVMIVPDHIQEREKNVKCVKDVKGHKKKIETNLVLESRHTFLWELRLLQTFRRRTNIESILPMTPNPPMMNINTPRIIHHSVTDSLI